MRLLHAQTALDLLSKQLTDARTDSAKVRILTDLSWEYLSSDLSQAMKYSNEAIFCAEKSKDAVLMAKAYKQKGDVNYHRNEFEKAVEMYTRSLKLYSEQGNDERAGVILTNIAAIYFNTKRNKEALEYFKQSYEISKKRMDTVAMATDLGNIAAVFIKQGRFTDAAQTLNTCLRYIPGSSFEMANELNNLGHCHLKLKEYDKALQRLRASHELCSKNGYDNTLISVLLNMGKVYTETRQLQKALACDTLALSLAYKKNSIVLVKDVQNDLMKLYEMMGDHKNAYRAASAYASLKDSILSEENQRSINELRTQYETEKKEKENIELKSKHETDMAVAEEKQKKLNVITYSITFGLVAVLLFSFILSSRLKITRQQKRIIEAQKQVVDEKQKEILDSIHYAQRIQNAILAREEDIRAEFPESFLLYRPKDIVAGDFYFFETTATHVFYAAADCTGHGVPGALVSVVCSNALTRCVKEFDLSDPGKILDKTRELVVNTFKKSGQDVKDGMDISLLVREKASGDLFWSGANNPLWKLHVSGDFEEVKANKQPIGLHENPVPFTSHQIRTVKGDSLFLFTDGLPDQFGGPKGKKYKYKRLQEKITESGNGSITAQGEFIHADLRSWMGSSEQVDDILLIGIRF